MDGNELTCYVISGNLRVLKPCLDRNSNTELASQQSKAQNYSPIHSPAPERHTTEIAERSQMFHVTWRILDVDRFCWRSGVNGGGSIFKGSQFSTFPTNENTIHLSSSQSAYSIHPPIQHIISSAWKRPGNTRIHTHTRTQEFNSQGVVYNISIDWLTRNRRRIKINILTGWHTNYWGYLYAGDLNKLRGLIKQSKTSGRHGPESQTIPKQIQRLRLESDKCW